MSLRQRTGARGAVVATLTVLSLALTACTGGSEPAEKDPRVGDGPLAAAQQKLLDTSGIDLTMTTKRLPRGVDGVRTLSGTLTAAPAFVEEHRAKFGRFIEDQILGWQEEKLVAELERHIGPDLQYIRINGTVVGALAGLAIAVLTELVR